MRNSNGVGRRAGVQKRCYRFDGYRTAASSHPLQAKGIEVIIKIQGLGGHDVSRSDRSYSVTVSIRHRLHRPLMPSLVHTICSMFERLQPNACSVRADRDDCVGRGGLDG